MNNPPISKKAYWDINFETLDFEKPSPFIMQKIFNYGPWEEQLAIMRYYGLARIKKEIVHAAYLRKPVLSFLCTILDLQKEDFESHLNLQSNPLPWDY